MSSSLFKLSDEGLGIAYQLSGSATGKHCGDLALHVADICVASDIVVVSPPRCLAPAPRRTVSYP